MLTTLRARLRDRLSPRYVAAVAVVAINHHSRDVKASEHSMLAWIEC